MAGTLNVAAPRSERERRKMRAYIKLSRVERREHRRTSVKRNVCARFAEYCGGDVHPGAMLPRVR